jgi:hypothetical protein
LFVRQAAISGRTDSESPRTFTPGPWR